MQVKELFEQIQGAIILDLKENEIPCPKCKGLRFYYVEKNGKGYIETCRECYAGKLYICKHCQKGSGSDYCSCEKAREERIIQRDISYYEKAEKLSPVQYDGWVYFEGLGHNEGYFEGVDELIEYCEDEEIDMPDWVYCCKGERHLLDIDSAIESMVEEAYEDAREHLKDEKELYDFVEKWNAKQNIISYYPDYKRIVMLKD